MFSVAPEKFGAGGKWRPKFELDKRNFKQTTNVKIQAHDVWRMWVFTRQQESKRRSSQAALLKLLDPEFYYPGNDSYPGLNEKILLDLPLEIWQLQQKSVFASPLKLLTSLKSKALVSTKIVSPQTALHFNHQYVLLPFSCSSGRCRNWSPQWSSLASGWVWCRWCHSQKTWKKKRVALKGPYNANSTFIVLLYVHMRSWHVSQPTNAWKKQFTLLVVIPRCQTRYG